jgi:hypothetical protein
MMKKVMLFVFVLLLSFTLLGCKDPDKDPAVILFNQYESYLEEDINSPEFFDNFLNEASNQIIPGIVTIKKTVKNSFGLTVDTKEGTGFIYEIYENSMRVLTAYELVTLESEEFTVSYEIYDYANRSYSALVLDRSEAYGLARLKFDTIASIARIRKLMISRYIPMDNEPLLMISEYQRTHNSMVMGLLESKNEETDRYITTIPADAYSVGGVVIDMRNEIVGLTIRYYEDQAVIIGLQSIRNYLNM